MNKLNVCEKEKANLYMYCIVADIGFMRTSRKISQYAKGLDNA